MEFTAISAHKSKTVSIKSLQGAVSHFEKVAFELHSADALLKPRHEMELEGAHTLHIVRACCHTPSNR